MFRWYDFVMRCIRDWGVDDMGKLPPQAKQVFKGIIFDVYQWGQKMFDGSTETFEMLKRPDTVEVITVVGDKILVGEQEQPSIAPFVSLPGGRVESGEEPLAAAKRELLEETGYASADWEHWLSFDPYQKIEWSIHWYIARDAKKMQEPHLDAGEKITAKLISFDGFIKLSVYERFWGGEFQAALLRMRLDPVKLAAFKKKLFG